MHKTIKKYNNSAGLTYVELLVVIVLVGLIGIMITQVFIIGLSSQAKNEIMKEVRTNGDFIMSVIEGMAGNATDAISPCNTSSPSLTIVNKDGYSTIFQCDPDLPPEGPHNISSVSAYPDPLPTETTILSASDKVNIKKCSFVLVCPTPPTSPKYIRVYYTVEQKKGEVTATTRSSLEYENTISLRNYQ